MEGSRVTESEMLIKIKVLFTFSSYDSETNQLQIRIVCVGKCWKQKFMAVCESQFTSQMY